ncbi:2-oxo acid dehydrogenase subunit E2 [Streptomyces sp. NPDC047043]|uniref:2-oxo acid dehydrogenase subunit E2 n=1 Tax=Streptomyces sp. NPDC047043 TaxID=3154497 RepID=UPI0033DB628D
MLVDVLHKRLLAAHAAHGTGLMPLLARVGIDAPAEFPELNSRVEEGRREIVLPQVHLGFAAQTDHGLVVPVARTPTVCRSTSSAASCGGSPPSTAEGDCPPSTAPAARSRRLPGLRPPRLRRRPAPCESCRGRHRKGC